MLKTIITLLVVSCCLISCQKASEATPPEPSQPTTISFTTADSLLITGELYQVDKTAASILLFHQARSNGRGEYRDIAPRLYEQGYNVLMIDQRRGGQIYGSYNRVVTELERNPYGYCDAYPDLEAALNYLIAEGYTGPKALWGSSYSAALVIKLAQARASDVAAVLAFSPASGEPMEGCKPEASFDSLSVPLLILRPGREMQIESVGQQMELAKAAGHQTYVAENGVHGSSMLVASRVDGEVAAHWEVVDQFLQQIHQ